ncbi:MAG: hypothetical protein U9O64_10815 [Campylobacterota bacterium]|nr:hypothetical protein [Campylobacterota bacterium]
MNYCEFNKYHIFDKIASIEETIFNRLLPAYNNIEEEAKKVEDEKLKELAKTFNPDIMDAGEAYQKAWEEGAEHYTLQHAMKTEFLLSTATWLFHLFEKDCREMCPELYNKPEDLKSELEKIGIYCDNNSDWYKINTELRLVANTIKHGEGGSYNRLKTLKPDYFEVSTSYLTDNTIEISEEAIQIYIENMKSFWESFFDKVLPKYK